MGCAQGRPQGGQLGGLNVQDRPGTEQKQQSQKTVEAKIVLLGDSGVGKSSLALRFCQGRFNPYHEVTIGAAFLQQIVRLRDGTQLKLHVWDTGGQERFRAMTHLYYRDAAGAVVVYDCTDTHSEASVKYWVNELQNKGPANVRMAVAANKSDMENKAVNPGQMKSYCDENNILFVETSAKTGDQVGQLFEALAARIAAESGQPAAG
eukprot:TRINITY_DN75276_c0_g1_i1.p1 TRINITY_DN75276_c0_g1~~TRINITY_DN75276_c0_g1_i1.p1  ORF type:complete len:240 (+),score=44.99 TRINITY_DN75276_c0_g1_i1:100-720(+)